MTSVAAAVSAANARRVRGEVFHDGYVEVLAEGTGWFGGLKWMRRYAILQATVLHIYNTEREFLDGNFEPVQRCRPPLVAVRRGPRLSGHPTCPAPARPPLQPELS